ncbi:MAG TPA: DMT family transporter [Bacillota bacterium]|nr:DMT family transporter [Bacillota bacterium]
MKGVIFSIAAGVFICLQAVFNTRLAEKLGFCGTNVFVHGTGLIVALIILLFAGDCRWSGITQTNPVYLLGGLLGVAIIYSIMMGVSSLGATLAIAIVLVVQLSTAAVIDGFGLFGNPQKSFHLLKLVGLAVMVAGIIIFQIKE